MNKRLLMMVLTLVAVLTSARAQDDVTEYDIWVGDVQVTSANADNVTGDHITAGKVSYDAATATLTFDNVVIEEVSAIVFGGNYYLDLIPELTVKLIGTNYSNSFECGIYAFARYYLNATTRMDEQPNIRFVSDDGTGEMNFYLPDWESWNYTENTGNWVTGSMLMLDGVNNFTVDNCTVRAGYVNGSYTGLLTVTNGGRLEAMTINGFQDLVLGEGIGFIVPSTGAVYHGKNYSSEINSWGVEYEGEEQFDLYVIGPKDGVDIEPITDEKETVVTINERIDETTDLTNTEVDNILYTLDETAGDGYDPTDGSIVVNSTTTSEELDQLLGACEPGSQEFANGFNGLTFLLPRGHGSFDIDCYTIGNRQLSVRIGTESALTFTRNERGTVTAYYDCAEETYVFVYGTSRTDAKPYHAATTGADAVKIYSIKVTPNAEPAAIVGVTARQVDKGTYYTVDGRKLLQQPTAKGVYIYEGKKIVVR